MNDIQAHLPKIIEKFLSGKYYWYILARQYNTTTETLKKHREKAIIEGIIDLNTALKIRKTAIENAKLSGYKNVNSTKLDYDNLIRKAIESQKKSCLDKENFSSYNALLSEIVEVEKHISEKINEINNINSSDSIEYAEVQNLLNSKKYELETSDIYKFYLYELKSDIEQLNSFYDELETKV